MLRRLAGAGVLLVLAASTAAEPVVRVKDGDTFVVASAGRAVDVRIADMDAPELEQAYGDQARRALEALVSGREVRLELVGGDVYRRVVANVFVDGRDVAAIMVGHGLAWVRRAYAPASRLIGLEDRARAGNVGLWSNPKPTPPWIWRKLGGADPSESAAGAPAPITPECGTKTRCAQMQSCEEAIAYLHQCRVLSMDGDGDGIPCENLCRYYR